MRNLIAASFLLPLIAFGQWDVTFDSAYTYNEDVSYTNQNILVSSGGYVVCNDTLTLNNCVLQVDGYLDCRGDIVLNNSTIEVKGQFNVFAGVEITETGASSVIATGDDLLEGEVNFLGNIYNKITVYSDFVVGDVEFLIIDPNSSPNSTIENTVFNDGFCNIWVINKRLSTPINNCFFYGAKYGIWQDGIDELTDIRFCLFVDNFDTAITLIVEPTALYGAEVLVDNVIIDNPNIGNSYGCVTVGMANPNIYGIFRFTNSIITNTYCGWYIEPYTYIAPILKNIAYYGNTYDDNLYDSSGFQQNPMYLTQSPFESVSSPGDWPYFLDPQSPAADVEPDSNLLQVCPDQLQASLFSDPAPRTNGIGIGVPLSFYYATNLYELEQDFNSDDIVNNLDFQTFAGHWQASGENPADFNDSNSVDTADLIHFCNAWLSDGSIRLNVTENEETLTVTYQDPNGLTDSQFAVFLDGRYIGMRDADNPILIINKSNFPNGEHYLRAIIIDGGSEEHYATASYTATFNRPLSNFKVDRIFDPDKGLTFSGDVGYGSIVNFEVKANNVVLWSDTFDDNFNVSIDPNTLGSGIANYEVSYICQPDVLLSILDILPAEMRDSLIASTQSSGSASALALEGKPDYGTAGLVICMLADGMNEGVSADDTGTARYAAKMMRQRGVNPIVLSGFGDCADVTYDTIMKVFKKYRKIHYMHIYAHGAYEFDAPYWLTGNIQRTGLRFNDGDWPVYNSRYWTDRGYNVPQDYEYLKSANEKGPYLGQFPFANGQLKILVLEACYGLRNVATLRADGLIEYVDGAYEDELRWGLPYHPDYPYSDICFAFGISNISQSAIGFGCPVIKSICPYADFAYFYNNLWFELGNGKSIGYAISHTNFSNLNDEVEENYRLRGTGDVTNIYLTTNP